MAFPTNLTNAVDGITDVMADHLNTLEAKVGIDGSLVTTSLDYLVKNPASDNPGHVHSAYQVSGSYITALTGDVAASGPGSAGATIQAGVISLAKMANLAANSLLGNNTADPATPLALSVAQVKSLLAIGQADVAGLTTASSPSFAALIAASLTSAGALGLNAGGLNQNIVLTPSGTGCTILNGKVGIGTTSPGYALELGSGSLKLPAGDATNLPLAFELGAYRTGLYGVYAGTVDAGIAVYCGGTQQALIGGGGIAVNGFRRLSPNTTFEVQADKGTNASGMRIRYTGHKADASGTFQLLQIGETIGYAYITGTGGIFRQLAITPVYNQTSGTAANTDLFINRIETAVGSGAQYLIDAQVGSLSKFNVTNLGGGYFAGSVGIGTTSPSAAALLHLSSTTKGFLPPAMATAQKNAIGTPPAGLVVYDSTLNKLCVYTGAAWETITSS
ncbi:MAG: hypothetical protein WC600_09045 [Desulfobaccales bacterium]